jgi:hypothetical protein
LVSGHDAVGLDFTTPRFEQFAQWVKTEIPAMAKIVKDEKITAE